MTESAGTGSGTTAFDRESLDSLYDELRRDWLRQPDYERLLRDIHLAIALSDAGRPLGPDIDSIVAELIEKHRPRAKRK